MTAPAVPASTPATTGEMSRIPGLKTHRNAELALLTFAMILVAVYGATVEANQLGDVSPMFWVPAALLSVLFLGLQVNHDLGRHEVGQRAAQNERTDRRIRRGRSGACEVLVGGAAISYAVGPVEIDGPCGRHRR